MFAWQAYFQQRGEFDITSHKGNAELKTLIRGGVPSQFRAEMWTDLINAKVAFPPL